jgi:1-deoxy-D-xylulose-5-phosphate reductoisomerase
VGAAGLRPTWAAIEKGLTVALANKESLVLGGELIMKKVSSKLIPVDSEHSAIFQALGGKLRDPNLRRIILTASGGPFRGWSKQELQKVSREMALKHPTWSMGPKITCDSATMMNKGLEVIEAHHLFGLDYDQIEVLVHSASLVHSLAEFHDGSILAQIGPQDMRLALAYALSHPERWALLDLGKKAQGQEKPGELGGNPSISATNSGSQIDGFQNYAKVEIPGNLTFAKPDREVFKALDLAVRAGKAGGTSCAILNGANEEAVAAFLDGKLSFLAIAEVVERCLEKLSPKPLTSVDGALEADNEARIAAGEIIRKGLKI